MPKLFIAVMAIPNMNMPKLFTARAPSRARPSQSPGHRAAGAALHCSAGPVALALATPRALLGTHSPCGRPCLALLGFLGRWAHEK